MYSSIELSMYIVLFYASVYVGAGLEIFRNHSFNNYVKHRSFNADDFTVETSETTETGTETEVKSEKK